MLWKESTSHNSCGRLVDCICADQAPEVHFWVESSPGAVPDEVVEYARLVVSCDHILAEKISSMSGDAARLLLHLCSLEERLMVRANITESYPAQRVVLGRGQFTIVNSFSAFRAPVTLSQFHIFVLQSDHVPRGHNLSGENYLKNQCYSGVPMTATVWASPLCWFSGVDALKYAEWRGARIATEAEYIAAAGQQWTELSRREVFDEMRNARKNDPLAYNLLGPMVALNRRGRLVERSGPAGLIPIEWDRWPLVEEIEDVNALIRDASLLLTF